MVAWLIAIGLILALGATAFVLLSLDIGRLIRDTKGAVNYALSLGSPDGLAGTSGPVIGAIRERIVEGHDVLVAGTVAVVLTAAQAEGLPNDCFCALTRVALGGAPGWVTANYVSATRTLTITSSNAGDTSDFRWQLRAPF